MPGAACRVTTAVRPYRPFGAVDLPWSATLLGRPVCAAGAALFGFFDLTVLGLLSVAVIKGFGLVIRVCDTGSWLRLVLVIVIIIVVLLLLLLSLLLLLLLLLSPLFELLLLMALPPLLLLLRLLSCDIRVAFFKALAGGVGERLAAGAVVTVAAAVLDGRG